jgi:CBS domain-containing protein
MDLASFAVTAVMHDAFTVLHPEDSLDAIDPTAGEIAATRHLIVIDAGGHVVGIVSLRDLLEASLARLRDPGADSTYSAQRSLLVSDLMNRPVETIGPGEMLAAAANRMISHRIGCLPVVRDDGVMIGVVTDADLLQAAYREPFSSGSVSTSGALSSSSR